MNLFCYDRGLSLNLELTGSVKLAGEQTLTSTCQRGNVDPGKGCGRDQGPPEVLNEAVSRLFPGIFGELSSALET